MKYFKIEGIIEISDENDLDSVVDLIINSLKHDNGFFGGGIKEVDSEGNDTITIL